MTREEGKEFANALKNNYTIDFDKLPEFCDMAISALSENKGDLISRQAVLDLFHMKYSDKELYKAIYELPSVENKGEPIECARTLKKHCINTKDCKECFMWDECKYELSAPCDWDLPESEKEGE